MANISEQELNQKSRDALREVLNEDEFFSFDSQDGAFRDGFESGYRQAVAELEGDPRPRPEVVVLCGSTRFKDQFNAVNARLTLEGKVVLSLGVFGHVDMPHVDWSTEGTEMKIMLDRLHKAKIDLADRVFIINPGGYIGESTRSEIDYALSYGKPIQYLERVDAQS